MKKKGMIINIMLLILTGMLLFAGCGKNTGSVLPGSGTREHYEIIDEKLSENTILKDSSDISYYFPAFYVSPYTTEEELEALAQLLSDVSMDGSLKRDYSGIDICCYSDILKIDLNERCSKDGMLKQIGDLFDKESPKGISAFDMFHEQLTQLDMVEESDSGELYIIIHDDDFNNDMVRLADTLDEIQKNDPLQDWHVRDYSYTYGVNGTKETVYYGYAGESISVYENSYSPDKKISERLSIEAGKIYDDIFKALICDTESIQAAAGVLNFETTCYKNNKYDYTLMVYWIEGGDALSVTELADCTYRIYQTAYTNMEAKGIDLDLTMNIYAVSSGGGYNNTEVERVNIDLDMNDVYTRQDWEKKICKVLTRGFESEAV